MKITHYDLFAGIGGFSLALDTIFNDQQIKHIFCEWEAFPTAVLKKHWPEAVYYGDIRDLVADTNRLRERAGFGEVQKADGEISKRHYNAKSSDSNSKHNLVAYTNNQGLERSKETRDSRESGSNSEQRFGEQTFSILTGGFPCQPFSHAGRRQGTADDRYLWPLMFETIKNVRPDWVIAENVRGLVTWNDGLVLETVCADLESEGYEVQPIVIPACAIGAPHRRDRVWIVAHTNGVESTREKSRSIATESKQATRDGEKNSTTRQFDGTNRQLPKNGQFDGYEQSVTSNPRQQLREQGSGKALEANKTIGCSCSETDKREHQHTWADDWREVAFATCHDGVDDGLPRQMDGTTISASRHRKERLKACGNAIVPQVAMQIFAAIKKTL